MPPPVATLVYIAGIAGLFFLDRDSTVRPSKALWIPVIWLLINASRPISAWMQSGPTIDSRERYLDGSPLDAIVFGILLVIGIGVLCKRGDLAGRIFRSNGHIILFFLVCAMSVLWSDYGFVAFKRWVKALGDVVMVLVVLSDSDRVSAVKRLLTRPGFILVPMSVLCIKYYPDYGRSYNPWTWIPMYSGVTMGKNLLGMTCLILGLGSVWLFVAAFRDRDMKYRTRHLLAHGTIIGMVVWLLFTADSMTSLSCFLMASGLITATSLFRWAQKGPAVHFLVVGLLCVSAYALFLDSGGGMVATLGRDPTLTGRTAVWEAVVSVRSSALLGAGFESFWLGDRLPIIWQKLNQPGVQEAHNGYLEVFLNLGWIGVSALAVVAIAGYRNALRSFRSDPAFGCICIAFFFVGMAYNLTEAGFRMMSPVWLAYLLAITGVPGSVARQTVVPHTDVREVPAEAWFVG